MEKKNNRMPLQDDDQLKTPAHDEMVLYCINEQNTLNLIPNLYKFIYQSTFTATRGYDLRNIWEELSANNIDAWGMLASQKTPEIWNVDQNNTNLYEYQKKDRLNKWDKILESFNDITSKTQQLKRNSIKVKSEIPILNNSFVVGYWDIKVSIKSETIENDCFYIHWSSEYKFTENIYIEIKPKITSFGDTLRQLRTYKQFTLDAGEDNVYLLTRDGRFNTEFESQGIKVLMFPDTHDERFTETRKGFEI